MYSHPEIVFLLAVERQRELIAQAERVRAFFPHLDEAARTWRGNRLSEQERNLL